MSYKEWEKLIKEFEKKRKKPGSVVQGKEFGN